MEDKIIDSFRKDFLSIKQKGWVLSKRKHDTGIGKTFEDLIGIHENNNFLADYKDVLELKSKRELSESMVTLFTKAPSYPKKVNSVLRKKYGQPDEKADNMKILHTTISANKFNTFANKFGFKLEVDEKQQKIFITIKNLQSDKIEDVEIYYDFEDAKNIIEKKCKYIAYISAETKKENRREYFKFTKAVLLSGLTFEKFIEFIKKGIIVYDIRLGVYRSGKDKGKTHDHGSGFRILKNNLSKVFNIKEL